MMQILSKKRARRVQNLTSIARNSPRALSLEGYDQNKHLCLFILTICTILATILVASRPEEFGCVAAENPILFASALAAHDQLDGQASNHTFFFADPAGYMTAPMVSSLKHSPLKEEQPDGNDKDAEQANVVFDDDEPESENEASDAEAPEEEEEDDEDEDENELEFFGKNSVTPFDFGLDDIGGSSDKEAKPSSIKQEKFHDFDDFDALHLKNFYRKRPKPLKSDRKRMSYYGAREKEPESKLRGKRVELPMHNHGLQMGSKAMPSDIMEDRQGQNSAARPYLSNRANRCVMPLSQSAVASCLTINMIEWALRRARRLMGGQVVLDSGSTILRPPSEQSINSIGELIELTSRILALNFHLTPEEVAIGLERIDTRETSLWPMCPRFYRAATITQLAGNPPVSSCLVARQRASILSNRYRTHSGRCNNLLHGHLGASHMPFSRMLEPAYSDSVGLPRGSLYNELPAARIVSLALHSSRIQPISSDLSALFANWGQLINHDLASASGGRDSTGHQGACCKLRRQTSNAVSSPLSRICFPIYLPPNDPVYAPYGLDCHEFKRSIAALRPGCSLGARSQVNLVTAFIDGSFVYGSSSDESRSLRSTRRVGQLATWYYFRQQQLKPLLPPQVESPDEECVGRPAGLYCFRSGDARTNQNLPLVIMHTIHTRQHNRLAEALATLNPHWTSDHVYHEARHIHVAMLQHIILNEYLPLLLGSKSGLLSKFNLLEADLYWNEYNPELNPSVSVEFAAAAFRQGHSSVPSLVYRLPFFLASGRRARVYPLRQLFRQPWPLFEPWALDEFLTGLLETPSQSVDQFVSEELSGHLLQEPDEAIGMDLVAINIQRGRDQGVASYNAFRQWCGLGRFETFEELKTVMSNGTSVMFAALYRSVDDIDLFSAGLAEFPLEDALVGPTFACMIAHQFRTLRQADRFWFESSAGPHAFTPRQLATIKQVTLARIICTNSDRYARNPMDTIQVYAMRLPHPVTNPQVSCSELPDVDLMAWQELLPPSVPSSETNNEQDNDDE